MKAIGHRFRANKSRQFFTQCRDFTGMLVGYMQVYDVYARSPCGLRGGWMSTGREMMHVEVKK